MKRLAEQFGRFGGSVWAVAVVLLILMVTTRVEAQSLWAEAGTSTMLRASGFDVRYKWSPVNGWFGAGWADGVSFGGFLETNIHHLDVGVGDRYQSLVLDTDVFDQSRYFAGRGFFVQKRGEFRTFSMFAGATAAERSTNFYHTFTAEQPTAGFFFEQKLGDRVSIHSIELVQDHLTSIQSMKVNVAENWDVSVAGGLGSGAGFLSFASQFQREHWGLLASYSTLGTTFQRIGGVTTNVAERTGANVRFRYQPKRDLQFTLSHENLISPTLVKDQVPQQVSLDSVSASTSIKGFRVGGGISASSSGSLHSKSENIGVSRNVTSAIVASGTLLRLENDWQNTNILIGSVQERISPRLSLNQGISSQPGNHQFTWGARWLSNRFTIGVQQDVLYTPLAGGFGGKSYTSFWSVNLITQLPHGLRLHADSYIDPAGRVRYTSWMDGIGFARGSDALPRGTATANSNFARFVVRGVVQDQSGTPVWGIAVQVDGETAFTDNTGHFFLRFKKGLAYPVAVLSGRSLNPQYYVVVQAPVSALAEEDDLAKEIVIVVKQGEAPKKKRSELDTPAGGETASAGAGGRD